MTEVRLCKSTITAVRAMPLTGLSGLAGQGPARTHARTQCHSHSLTHSKDSLSLSLKIDAARSQDIDSAHAHRTRRIEI